MNYNDIEYYINSFKLLNISYKDVMYILFGILFILQIFFCIYFLIKSIKKKNILNWVISISINISSIIKEVLIMIYYLNNKYIAMDDNLFAYLIISVAALICWIVLLIINFILKFIENLKNKKNTKIKFKNKLNKKAILIPFILNILVTSIVCGIDYSRCISQKKEESNSYFNIRKKEINKMSEFLNNKYNVDIKDNDCTYYREQDYTMHSDLFGNGSTYNIPYIAVFKYLNKEITVVDREGFISDNWQLEDINNLLVNYFYKKTGILFEYVEFQKSYIGSWSGNDNVINSVLQYKFNDLITENNIELFTNYILQEKDLSITFYINDDNVDINKITSELSYLKNYPNIRNLKVYGNKDTLVIEHKSIEFPNERIDYGNQSEDYDDGYKFGCYYVNTELSKLTFSLNMEMNSGYSDTGEFINGWRYRLLN